MTILYFSKRAHQSIFLLCAQRSPTAAVRNSVLSAELSPTQQATVDLCCLQDLGSHLVVCELRVNKIEEILQRLAKQQYSV